MSTEPKTKIVCMIRSGGAGRKVQERAIELARQSGKKLIFLHVIDLQSITLENERLLEPARQEMTWLASVSLSLAGKLARDSGIQAETEVRYGPVYEVAVAFLEEVEADTLLLGAPHPQVNAYELRLDGVRRFAQRISRATGIQTEVVVSGG